MPWQAWRHGAFAVLHNMRTLPASRLAIQWSQAMGSNAELGLKHNEVPLA